VYMDYTYINIGSFILTTIIYYMMKPPMTYKISINSKESDKYEKQTLSYEDYTKWNNIYLAMYFVLNVVIQTTINAINITSTCGGETGDNIAGAFVLTCLPWTLIFGVIIVTLIINPGFKSVFSDIIGYYSVSSQAHNILTTLLVNEELEEVLETGVMKGGKMKGGDGKFISEGGVVVPVYQQSPVVAYAVNQQNSVVNAVPVDPKGTLRKASDVITKIFGNPSFLINSVVPRNFADFWSTIDPLIKPSTLPDEREEMRKQLFGLSYKRDNIGEFTWYVYTGILIASIVQMKLARRGCISDQATMEKKHQKYLEEEAKAKEAKDKANSQTYTQ